MWTAIARAPFALAARISAGASPIIILVERVPPDLLVALDRLRSEGVAMPFIFSGYEVPGGFPLRKGNGLGGPVV